MQSEQPDCDFFFGNFLTIMFLNLSQNEAQNEAHIEKKLRINKQFLDATTSVSHHFVKSWLSFSRFIYFGCCHIAILDEQPPAVASVGRVSGLVLDSLIA